MNITFNNYSTGTVSKNIRLGINICYNVNFISYDRIYKYIDSLARNAFLRNNEVLLLVSFSLVQILVMLHSYNISDLLVVVHH